jgi:hypothetical protein
VDVGEQSDTHTPNKHRPGPEGQASKTLRRKLRARGRG